MVDNSSNVACQAWQDLALGTGTGSAAYSECAPGTLSISTNAVTAPGATADNQHLVYQELCGNGEIIVKVESITNSGYAGLFVRESSATGALKGARVEDAQYAVRPMDKSVINIESSVLEDNYVGLYFEGPYTFDLYPFAGNTLSAQGDLLPPFAGQSPAPGLRAFAGIQIADRSDLLHIGVAGAPLNVFENLRNGIITNNTPLFVERSRFEGITASPAESGYPFTGYGIRHEGGAAHPLQVLGMGAGGQANFNNCTQAVWTQDTDTRVRNSRMTAVSRGVQVSLAQQRKIELYYNYIECGLRGIELMHNDPAALVNLHHNTIHAGSASPLSKAVGILISEQGLAHTQAVIGPRNSIHTYGQDIGLFLGSAAGYYIAENEFELHNAGQSLYAILVRDALNGTLATNDISGAGTNSGTGIDVFASTGMIYSCNTLHNLHTGLHLDGVCTDSDISGNVFSPPLGEGLHYGSLLDINAQLHRGNQWLAGSYANAAARNDLVDSPDVLDKLDVQRYEVHDNSSVYYPPSFAFPNLPPPIGAYTAAWFPVDPEGDPWGCDQELSGEEIVGIRDLDKSLAQAQGINGGYGDARLWGARQQLYRKIALLGGQTDTLVVDSFYVSQTDSLLGVLYEMETNKKSLFEPMPVYQQELNAMTHEQDSLIQLLAIADSLLLAEQNVWELRNSLMEQTGTLTHDIDSIDGIIKAAIYQTAGDLAEDNEGLESSKGYAQNEIVVNAVYLSALAGGTGALTTGQISELGSIAGQCPHSGGRSVFKAQQLLHLPYPDSLMLEWSCEQALFANSPDGTATIHKTLDKRHTQGEPLMWKVYPNPADNVLYVDLTNAMPLTISIMDIYHRPLLIQQVAEAPHGQQLALNLGSLNNGLYLLELKGVNISLQLKKVVIVK